MEGQGVGGRDITDQPGCVQNVFMQQATFGVLGSERVCGSRLDTGRRPLQGSLVSEDLSRVRLRPASVPFGNRYIGRDKQRGQSLMTIPQSDHNTAPSPDRPETDPIASSKDPKGSCQSSFAGVHSSQHLMWFTAFQFMRHLSLKCETSKVATLLRNHI